MTLSYLADHMINVLVIDPGVFSIDDNLNEEESALVEE